MQPVGTMPRITHRKLFPPIVDCHAAQAGGHARLLDRLVKSPDLEHGLAAEVLLLRVESQPPPGLHVYTHRYHTPTVTSKLVPSTWRMWETRTFSWAWKLRTIRQLGPTMRTWPSELPRKRLSEPEQTLDISLPSKKARVSSSSASLTWLTSKKSKDFHCGSGRAGGQCIGFTRLFLCWEGGEGPTERAMLCLSLPP